MSTRIPVIVAYGLCILLLSGVAASGATVAKAPPIRATPEYGTYDSDMQRAARASYSLTELQGLDSIGPVADPEAGRSVLGAPGKNIWLCPDGDTVLVVYAQPSGLSDSVFLPWVAYSYDRGHTWENALSTIGRGPSTRVYPGVVTPADTLVPYVTWQYTRGPFSGAKTHSSVWFEYDEFFPFMLYTPRLIEEPGDTLAYHMWFACPVTTPSGDTVLVSCGDINHAAATQNAYLYRSFDGGLTWQPKILMINSQGTGHTDIDNPVMKMGEGGYVFAYFEWSTTPGGGTPFLPYYTESMDYGATWSTPSPLPLPYALATGWWYGYDVVLDPDDNYKPHIGVKFGTENFEFGDVWEYHPTGGSPGSWTGWVYNLLIGDGIGGNYATQASIGRDVAGNLFVVFSAFFIHSPTDTFGEIGVCYSADRGTSWSQPEPLTYDPIVETCIELANFVSDTLHGVYIRERDNCQSLWHFFAVNPAMGVEEEREVGSKGSETRLLQSYPNPFSHSTTMLYTVSSSGHTALRVYDLTGRLVRSVIEEEKEPGTYRVSWDGTAEDGSPVPSGIYLYRLNAGSYSETRKLTLIR